jgi:hypothetical protein
MIQQSQHAQQRLQMGDRIVSASELLTQVSARHPSRDIDDLLIDDDFETGRMSILDLPNDSSFPTKQGMQRVFYSGLPAVAGIENITLASVATTVIIRTMLTPGSQRLHTYPQN